MVNYDKYCVIDFETTSKSSYKRTANPMDSENSVVAVIYKKPDDPVGLYIKGEYARIDRYDLNCMFDIIIKEDVDILVGHNIAFDLLYMWNSCYSRGLMKFISRGGTIWDTQIAEFYISGQHSNLISNSMDTVAGLYNLPKKPPIKEYLSMDNGEGFRNVPDELKEEYMTHDGNTTEAIYLQQLKIARRDNLLKILQIHMDYRLATISAEYNGLCIDETRCREVLESSNKKLISLRDELFNLVKHKWPVDKLVFNPNSTKHVKACLFGETFTKKNVLLDDGSWKMTGGRTPSLKEVAVDPYYVNVFEIPMIVVKRKPTAPTDAEFLKNTIHTPSKLFRELLLEYRYHSKMEGTYITPLLENKYPDGRIRGQFNHSNTVTGRISSSNPNLQNIHGDLKEVFITDRPTTWLAEIDYSTIEVSVAAYISGCTVLKRDLLDGIDMHRLSASFTLGKPEDAVTEQERKDAKRKTFSWLYGAGEGKVGHRLFEHLATRYKEILTWQDQFYLTIQRNETVDRFNERGTGALVQTVTGKRYWFPRYNKTEVGEEPTKYVDRAGYSPTARKDYPIQGEAADLLARATGKAFRYIIEVNSKEGDNIISLLSCIHDSMIIEFKTRETLDEHLNKINSILLGVVEDWKELFGVEIDVPIQTKISISNKSWADCKNNEYN